MQIKLPHRPVASQIILDVMAKGLLSPSTGPNKWQTMSERTSKETISMFCRFRIYVCPRMPQFPLLVTEI